MSMWSDIAAENNINKIQEKIKELEQQPYSIENKYIIEGLKLAIQLID